MDVVGMPCVHDVRLSTMNIFDPLMPPEHGRWRMRCESRGDICEATIKPKKQRRRRDVILCHHLDESVVPAAVAGGESIKESKEEPPNSGGTRRHGTGGVSRPGWWAGGVSGRGPWCVVVWLTFEERGG